ncbi:hypothetical protein ACFWRV_00010 [Streptomyces sp. NPDC058576]|uniref:hypothetical protein n=1 Tax=Streptomyces sp. NPDC058576 TaxID=3346547 RepID=UPI00365CE905
MPKPIRMNRRTWVAAWAALCAAGLVATAQLENSSAPGPPPEKPVSAECRKFIADIDTQLARAGQRGEEEGVLAFSRSRVDTGEGCHDALRAYFRSHR